MSEPTNYEALHGKRITNVYDGRPDGSVLIRLDDRTELLVRSGAIMLGEESLPIGGEDRPTLKITSLCGCAWETRVDPDALFNTTVRVDVMCPTHDKLGAQLELTSPVNAYLLAACKEYKAAVEDPARAIRSAQKMVDARERLDAAIAKAQP